MKLQENSLAVLQKVNLRMKIYPSNSIPRYIPERIENWCSNGNLYTNAHSSTIHNNQKVAMIQMPINWWMDKQNVVHPHSEILLNHRQVWNTDTSCSVSEP